MDTAIGILVMFAAFAVLVGVAILIKRGFFLLWKLVDETAPRSSEEAHRRRQRLNQRRRRR